MRRREFITLLGGAAVAWPLAARAQQKFPVIGYFDSGLPGPARDFVAAFHQGLRQAGYIEGQNVATEYRWGEDQNDRLPELAADLVRRRVAVIVTPGSTLAALAAKAATNTIPIVFGVGSDPVELGLVASLNKPGGNLTGISRLTHDVATKRLALLHNMIPSVTSIAVLTNPTNRANEVETRELQVAATELGLHLLVINSSSLGDIEAAFSTIVQHRVGGLLVNTDALFLNRREELAALTARDMVPAIYAYRDYVAVGGLMSYGASMSGSFRQVGLYTGRILKGEKPFDLPVMQPTKFELALNLRTAKGLRLTVPPNLLALADEVIE
jgi:putative tryptophan/tyrosine transport system substrate-binding protein